MKTSIICAIHQIFGWPNLDEVDKACGIHKMETVNFCSENVKKRNHLEDISMGERII
jgi:hypothetical protein